MNIVVIPPFGIRLSPEQAINTWLPRIGPTSYLLHAKLLEMHGQPVDPTTLSASLGVAVRRYNSAVNRLIKFGLIALDGNDLVVRNLPIPKEANP